ncbi:hypothetical protein CPB83DRAFT_845643 [Crepidotus variabilis]|uniref:Uncharacterized protein n=1 Tax=Crepidotus variabilis TaxID=179855 RepID=A0A9P6EPL0_9AGAR|nr:hypothetical protein CPB83DRAFT_845643 [Crepidotus variabilis]
MNSSPPLTSSFEKFLNHLLILSVFLVCSNCTMSGNNASKNSNHFVFMQILQFCFSHISVGVHSIRWSFTSE